MRCFFSTLEANRDQAGKVEEEGEGRGRGRGGGGGKPTRKHRTL